MLSRICSLLVWNRLTESNETWQEARSHRSLPSLYFWADRKTKIAALVSDWLRNVQLLLWNRWTQFNETWREARSHHSLPSLLFEPVGKRRWPPQLLIGWDILDLSFETTEHQSTNLGRKQDRNVLYQVCCWSENKDSRPGHNKWRLTHCDTELYSSPTIYILSLNY